VTGAGGYHGRMARLLTLLASALVLAGCGAGAPGGAPAADAAGVAPADARAFALLSTDAGAEQTAAVLELLERFPAVAEHEPSLRGDVLPALGPEAALVVLASGEKVVLARPDDPARLEELLGRMGKRPVTRVLEGWTAIARDAAALDTLERGLERGALSADGAFREAFDALPADAAARLWTGERARGPLGGVAAAVVAEEDGLRLAGFRTSDADAEPYRAELLDRVPAGSALVVSFRGREGLAERLRMLPFPSVPGLDALAAQLEGEGVLHVRPAAPVPELTLLARVEDEAAAADAAGRLLLQAGRSLGGPPLGIPGGRVAIGPVTVLYAARGGLLAVTTSPAGLEVLDPAESPLSGDPRFEQAAERAGLPDETTGFLYARMDELAPMLGVLGMLHGRPPAPELRENLAPLGALVLHGGRDGDRATLHGFLEIR
jgi:hypothetical protein